MDGFVEALGFGGPASVLDDIYVSLDDNGSGSVTFDEFNGWLKGVGMTTRKRVDAAKQLFIPASRVNVDEKPWDTNRLRAEINRLVNGANLHMADVFTAWDDDGNGRLRKKEWLLHFKKLTKGHIDETLWYSKIRNAVSNAFREIDQRGEGTLDLTELVLWLHQTHESHPPDDSPIAASGALPHRLPRGAGGSNSLPSLKYDVEWLTRQYTGGSPGLGRTASEGSVQLKLPNNSLTNRKKRQATLRTHLPAIVRPDEGVSGSPAEQRRQRVGSSKHHHLHDRYQSFLITRMRERRSRVKF